MGFKTPSYGEILDTYIAYGFVESLLRAGIEELILIPQGEEYTIEVNASKDTLLTGIADALREMLSLHYALGRYSPKEGGKVVSDADFSAGANINNVYWNGVPSKLKEILDKIESRKRLSTRQNITAPLTLIPTAGKFLPKTYGVKGGNPIKMRELDYALAWIGFHYYAPYINISDSDSTYIHIYLPKPLEPVKLIEVLSLKDLKAQKSHYHLTSNKPLTNSRVALLYHLTHTETLGALETITKKQFTLITYTLERVGNNQAARSFGELDIAKLMDFLWNFKSANPYYALRFVDALKDDLELTLEFVDGILNEDADAVYLAIRGLQRKNPKVVRPELMEAIARWLDKDQAFSHF